MNFQGRCRGVSEFIKVLQEFKVYSRALWRASEVFQRVAEAWGLMGFLEYFRWVSGAIKGFRGVPGMFKDFKGVPGDFQ